MRLPDGPLRSPAVRSRWRSREQAPPRSRARLLEIGLSSLSLPAIVLLFFPAILMRRNLDEIVLHPGDTLVFLHAFGAVAVILFAVTALWRKRERLILILTAGFILNLIFWNALSAWVWPHGARLFLTAALELGVFLLTLKGLSRAPTQAIMHALCIYSMWMVPVSLWQLHSLNPAPPSKSETPARKAKRAPVAAGEGANRQGNVYHIVLDEFSVRYLTGSMARGRTFNWDGYTLYRNAASEYGRTNYSLRSVFQGKVYRPGRRPWFRKSFSTGLLARLHEVSVTITQYPFYERHCVDFAAACNSTIALHDSLFGDGTVRLVTDLTFLNLLPTSVKGPLMGSYSQPERPRATWDFGVSLTSTVLENLGAGGWLAWKWIPGRRSQAKPAWTRHHNTFTIETFEQLLTDESQRGSSGEYVFAHLIMPHGPLLRDQQCRYVGPGWAASSEALDAQYECALTIIESINDTLRRLARYDDSLIVIHSDHGIRRAATCARWDESASYDPAAADVDIDETMPQRVSSQQIDCLTGILFLLKPPHAHGFATSDAPVQLVDIAPTVADFFSLKPSANWEGISLLKESEQLRTREKRFFGTTTNRIEDLAYFTELVGGSAGWRLVRTFRPDPDDYR